MSTYTPDILPLVPLSISVQQGNAGSLFSNMRSWPWATKVRARPEGCWWGSVILPHLFLFLPWLSQLHYMTVNNRHNECSKSSLSVGIDCQRRKLHISKLVAIYFIIAQMWGASKPRVPQWGIIQETLHFYQIYPSATDLTCVYICVSHIKHNRIIHRLNYAWHEQTYSHFKLSGI